MHNSRQGSLTLGCLTGREAWLVWTGATDLLCVVRPRYFGLTSMLHAAHGMAGGKIERSVPGVCAVLLRPHPPAHAVHCPSWKHPGRQAEVDETTGTCSTGR